MIHATTTTSSVVSILPSFLPNYYFFFFFFVSSVQFIVSLSHSLSCKETIMEFPFGGHHHNRPHHRHHHRNEDEEAAAEEYPQPPPPPSFGTTIESHQHNNGPPPPPPPSYLYEQDGMFQTPLPPPPNPNYNMYEQDGMYQRPPPSYLYEQDGTMFQRPPPPQPDFSGGYSSGVYSNPPVQHVSHELEEEEEDPSHEFRHHTHLHHHHHNPIDDTPPPPPPSFVYQHTHETETETDVVGDWNELSNLPTVRVYSKAEPSYSLTIRDARVILAPSDPTDVFQHWIKDEKYSVRVKDEEGFPSFSLVNKATGLTIKHSIGATHPVQLQPYNPDDLDASVLWTESRDLGDGFRTIRMINNIRLNLDAFNGDINHGGVHDGTTIVLWEWKKGDNQRWRIVRYCKSFNTSIQKGI